MNLDWCGGPAEAPATHGTEVLQQDSEGLRRAADSSELYEEAAAPPRQRQSQHWSTGMY